jgi:hypothetical protein
MAWLHQAALWLHIICGTLLLGLFWLPLLSKKGGAVHSRSGRYFSYAMYGISSSGVLMCALVLWDPIAARGIDVTSFFTAASTSLQAQQIAAYLQQSREFAKFLLLLSLLAYVNLRHGLLVLQAGPERLALKHWSHQLAIVALLGSAIVLLLSVRGQVLYWVFAVVAMMNVVGIWRYMAKVEISRHEVLRQHISNMLACGIAIYTAFFAFGGRSLLDLHGSAQLVSWLLPSVLGLGAMRWFYQRYTKSK